MRKIMALVVASLPFVLSSCGTDDSTENDRSYDPQLLAEYRAALPKASMLTAATPVASGGGREVGQSAEYPPMAVSFATGVNGAIAGIVGLLDQIVVIDPTVYNSDTREFVWGPWANEGAVDGFGYVAVYIRENPEEENPDFRFSYAFLRGASNDMASLAPVIWGAATPDETNEDFGTGITMFDFEANYAFAEANDPSFDAADHARGRFVALYNRNLTEDTDDGDAIATWVVAVFRNFIDRDAPAGAQGADIDYLYGRYERTSPDRFVVDFLNIEADADINDTPESAEHMRLDTAFINQSFGRAEATVTGASLDASVGLTGVEGTVVECWDPALDQLYYKFSILQNESTLYSQQFGNGEADCIAPFQQSLASLPIPTLDDEELGALIDQMGFVAENGIPQQE